MDPTHMCSIAVDRFVANGGKIKKKKGKEGKGKGKRYKAKNSSGVVKPKESAPVPVAAKASVVLKDVSNGRRKKDGNKKPKLQQSILDALSKAVRAKPLSSARVAPVASTGGRGKRKAKENVVYSVVDSSDDDSYSEN